MTVGEICTILGVVISAAATISAILHNSKQAKDNYFRQMQENKDGITKMNGKIDGIKIQMADLSEKVQKHNNMVERTYHLESEQAKMSAQIDELRHDVRDLKCKC